MLKVIQLEGIGCPASISYKTYFDTDEVRACCTTCCCSVAGLLIDDLHRQMSHTILMRSAPRIYHSRDGDAKLRSNETRREHVSTSKRAMLLRAQYREHRRQPMHQLALRLPCNQPVCLHLLVRCWRRLRFNHHNRNSPITTSPHRSLIRRLRRLSRPACRMTGGRT